VEPVECVVLNVVDDSSIICEQAKLVGALRVLEIGLYHGVEVYCGRVATEEKAVVS
jgi:hypothetical protein